MKKLLFTLIIIFPFFIWGQDTYITIESASGPPVNKKVQLPENVTVDGTAFTGTFAGLSITNLLEALNAVDAFTLGSPGSGSFDPNSDLTANDANWNWTRLGQNIFRISDTDNRVDINATFRIGTGATLSGARVSHYYTSSFDTAEYKFRKATSNNGAYISGGTTSAANDIFEIRANGDINTAGQFLINETPVGGMIISAPASTFDINGFTGMDDQATDTSSFTIGSVTAGMVHQIIIDTATEPTIVGSTVLPNTQAFIANSKMAITFTVNADLSVSHSFKQL